jgi:hypothetical protein
LAVPYYFGEVLFSFLSFDINRIVRWTSYLLKRDILESFFCQISIFNSLIYYYLEDLLPNLLRMPFDLSFTNFVLDFIHKSEFTTNRKGILNYWFVYFL